jgi:hypothetical protein
MANARVPDEEIFYRDPNIHRVESIGTYYQPVSKTKFPRWCPEGLTKTHKRRMQHERQEDLYREEKSSNEKSGNQQWQVKHKDKGPSQMLIWYLYCRWSFWHFLMMRKKLFFPIK